MQQHSGSPCSLAAIRPADNATPLHAFSEPSIRLFLLMLAAILFLAAAPVRAADHGRSVLVIQSYHPDLDWTRLCDQGIRDTLGADHEISTFYMDTKRIAQSQFDQRAQEAWQAYLDTAPDLVMLGDDNALRLLGNRFADTDTPVVFFGINNNPRTYFDRLPTNITGLLERTPLFPWLRYLREIMPQAKRALVLMDTSLSSAAIINVTFQNRASISISGMEVEYRLVSDWHQWQTAIGQSADFDFIVSPTFHSIKQLNGAAVDIDRLISWTSANSSAPLFTNQDYTVSDHGAAGAYTLSATAHGAQAAEIAALILGDGQQPSTIMFQVDKAGLYVFNRQQLDRHRITLPEAIASQARWQ